MLTPMTRVRMIGPKSALVQAIEELHTLGIVHLDVAGAASDSALDSVPEDHRRDRHRDELSLLLVELDALLSLVPATDRPAAVAGDHVPGSIDASAMRAAIAPTVHEVEERVRELEELEAEAVVLPRYVQPLRQLLPLVPWLADLSDRELALLRLDTAALVLNLDDDTVVSLLRAELEVELGERFELVATPVDESTVGCVLVFPHDAGDSVHGLLGREHVRHVALPTRYSQLSLRGAVEAMEERERLLPAAIQGAEEAVRELVVPHAAEWQLYRTAAAAELEQLEAIGLLRMTDRAYVMEGWWPRSQGGTLREELDRRLDGQVAIEESKPARVDSRVPVLLHNVRLARPFEALVEFLDVPRSASLDPSLVMCLFLPLMFGIMVGDVGYGVILLFLGLYARRRFARSAPVLRDISFVLVFGAAWSLVFGVLFGEFFGDVGKRIVGYDWAVWMYRPGAEALEPLLLFAIAIGIVHVVLGIVLGMWQAARFREPRTLLDRLGTLLVLIGLFTVAGVAADQLPEGAMTPAVALAVVGLVLVLSLHGAMGLVMGPLELLGTLGNILSYLRLAAVGLASAYLAIVANELALAGPIWLGIIVGTFFHTLNLALAGFSPMVQALRLHYVECFSKFFEGGGTPFHPFGERQTMGAETPRAVEQST
ncbi:MAG: hypothetical protein LH654_14770 [Thermoleophilia bacterium]|nr:hypothetical protein [Thermoleophilia bacterium]